MFKLLVITVVLFCYSYGAIGANILGISPLDSMSHFKVVKPLFMELAKRGHNITVITFKEDTDRPENYRIIKINVDFDEKFKDNKATNMFEFLDSSNFLFNFWIRAIILWEWIFQVVDLVLDSTNVQHFLKNDKTDFDVIICEDFNLVPMYMFTHKYKAPLVTYSTYGNIHYVNDLMGNPLNLQYVPDEFLPYSGKLTLWQKVESVITTYANFAVRNFYFMPKYRSVAKKHFSSLEQPLPDVRDIEKNISLHLINTHFSVDFVRPLLPNMIEVGGIHLEKIQPLPKDLQEILDNAKKGVIFFSLGSNLKSSQLPKDKLAAFVQAFSRLEQTVLWKYEEDDLPGLSSNIIIRKWLPQSDILAHPNVRIFITQGGILSLQEALRKGVPLIGLPIYGDQPANIAKARDLGYAEKLEYRTLDFASVSQALDKVLNDPSYWNNAKEASRKYHDKPFTAMETAIYWIEYVIRHKGAYHMKTPSTAMSWYEYYLVDVIAVIAIAATVVCFINYLILKYILKALFKKMFKSKDISNNKKNK